MDLADGDYLQGLHACLRVVDLLLHEATVYHVSYVGNSEGGFCDVSGEDDLPAVVRGLHEGVGLLFRCLRTIQWDYHHGRHFAFLTELRELLVAAAGGGLALLEASEEDEDVAGGFVQVDADGDLDGGLHALLLGRLLVEDGHGVAPA